MENSDITAIIAILLSIVAIGGFVYIITNDTTPQDLTSVENSIYSTDSNVADLKITTKNLEEDIDTLRVNLNRLTTSGNLDKNYLDNIESDLQDDIDSVDDDVRDLKRDVNDINDIFDCMKTATDLTELKICI